MHPAVPLPHDGGRALTVLTPTGQTPPQVVTGTDHVIVFDGRLDDRDALDGRAGGDADLMLRAFVREGGDAFAKLRGPFAVVIWNRAGDSVVCAHDALGAFPLFYAQLGQDLLVSPFQDVLVGQPRVPKQLDAVALAEWILYSVADVSDTFFTGIKRLPPAHRLSFDRAVELRRYWHPENDPSGVPAQPDEVHAAFDELLVQAVERCLRPPRAGVLLSGGVDSGVVAAVAAERTRAAGSSAPLALGAAFPDRSSNEVAGQRAVAAALGIELVLLPVDEAGPEGILLPVLQSARDSALPSTVPWETPYSRLAAVARERGCRSLLTGDGGNELLEAGWELAADLLRASDVRALRRLYRLGRSYYGASRRRMLWRLGWRSGARIVVRERIGTLAGTAGDFARARYLRRYDATIHASLIPDQTVRRRVVERMLALHPAPGRGPVYAALRRARHEDPGLALQLESNFAWDRHVGLETLSPLMDVDLIRFLYHVPPELLSFGGRAKGLAQASLERRVATSVLPQLRAAFFEDYFQTVMLREGRRALAALGGVPILSGLGIADEKALHLAVDSSYAPRHLGYSHLWAILGLEAWLRARL